MNKKRRELVDRLAPYAAGCFSGNVAEWPQLKPLLKDVFDYLRADERGEYKYGSKVYSQDP
jgi:hypothetical protein